MALNLSRWIIALETVLVFCGPALGAHRLIIDDFSSGPLSATLTAASTGLFEIQTDLSTDSVIGGQRGHTTLLNFPVPATAQATVTVDEIEGTYRVASNNAGLEAYGLRYGKRTINEAAPSEPLDADFSGLTYLEFDVRSSALGHVTGIQLRSGVDEGAIQSAVSFIMLPAKSTPYTVLLNLGNFGSIDLSDIDYLSVGEGPISSGFDFVLDRIAVVPQPPPGDFDRNDTVDGRDFLVWQRGASPKPLTAADLQVWQQHYGSAALSNMIAVPEPSTLTSMTPVVLILGRNLRQRRAR